jgi:signal peptidase I
MKNQTNFQSRTAGKCGGGERRNGDAAKVAVALRWRGRVSLLVQGSSMLPWVRPGDIAILGKISPDDVRCGDIVLFRRDNRFFVHRIVERRTRVGRVVLVTKGDANPYPDGALAPSEILGHMERIYRGDRRIEFHSRRTRALSYLIAQVSRESGFWFVLVRAHRIATGTARRLLRTIRISQAPAS